jgi:hypothetical protein
MTHEHERGYETRARDDEEIVRIDTDLEVPEEPVSLEPEHRFGKRQKYTRISASQTFYFPLSMSWVDNTTGLATHPCGCVYDPRNAGPVIAYKPIKYCAQHAQPAAADEMKKLAESSAEEILKLAMKSILDKELALIRQAALKSQLEMWMSDLSDAKQADRLAEELQKLKYKVEKKTWHDCNWRETCAESGCHDRYKISWG